MATTVKTSSELIKLTPRQIVGAYLELTKLRIVTLLLFTTITAMVVAADGVPPLHLLLPTILGGAFASGGASVINQYYDRDMDAIMTRTARRPIPSGRVKPLPALIYGVVLVLLSVVVLGVFVNWLAALLALGGAVYYVVIYTMVLKRNTVLNILIGGGAGAMPVLVGWSAVTGDLSAPAWLLFAIVFFWTPPHSWALALLVNQDYTRANVPMMPVAKGEDATRSQIILYSVILLGVSMVPFQTLGWIYLVAAFALGLRLVSMAVMLKRDRSLMAARATYKYSTAYLAFLFLAMMMDRILL
ncbi:MAG: protoheme IX farnesyltransferase [Anaerolineae bacterium]|nr:protoheme IX farnesyltransferase [Anaerolineae bacterium]